MDLPPADLIFRQTGVQMWFIHLAMSAVFALLLGGMYRQLRRPLLGWLSGFFVSRVLVGAALAAYWAGGFTSFFATLTLAILMASALTLQVPLLAGAMRTMRLVPALDRRLLLVSGVLGSIYGISIVTVLMQWMGRSDITTSLQFRPLLITVNAAIALIVLSPVDMPTQQRGTRRFLQIGVLGLVALTMVETAFRIQVSISAGSSVAMSGTVVSNLLGLLLMGVCSLLAALNDARVQVRTDIDREERLSRQDAEAARLESLGRMANGIASDFDRVLSSIADALPRIRRTWHDTPDVARADLRVIRQAVDRGGRLTRRLMLLARQENATQQRFRPVEVMQDLVPLLEQTVGNGQVLDTHLGSDHAVWTSPSQLEQLLLNLVLNALEALPPGGRIQLRVEDVELASPLVLSHGTCGPGSWVRITVQSGDGVGTTPNVPRAFALAAPDLLEVQPGIDMLMVRHATQDANGRLHVDEGATPGFAVQIWLPAVSQAVSLSESAGIA